MLIEYFVEKCFFGKQLMEFFRQNRKIIVGILVIMVGIWLLGATILIPILAR